MNDNKQLIEVFWNHMNNKSWQELTSLFSADAEIIWPNTKEEFSVSLFVKINELYPGSWSIDIEQLLSFDDTVISVVRVTDGDLSFHAISFFYFSNNKISLLQEYWSQDGNPPENRIITD